jgi:hypothetical protein
MEYERDYLPAFSSQKRPCIAFPWLGAHHLSPLEIKQTDRMDLQAWCVAVPNPACQPLAFASHKHDTHRGATIRYNEAKKDQP